MRATTTLVETAALLTPFPALNESSFAGGSSIYPLNSSFSLMGPEHPSFRGGSAETALVD